VSASTSSASLTQVVKFTASVKGSVGGSLDFESDGTTITGCGAVPVLNAGRCDTSSLREGTHSIRVLYSGDATSAASTSTPVSVTVGPIATNLSPPAIPGPGHAYLGAWLKPLPAHQVGATDTPLEAELQQLPAFNQSLARPLSIVHVFQAWDQLTPSYQLGEVLANGATPMIDWECGVSDQLIIDGQYDAYITKFAKELAALRAPVFLRWFPEPNFPAGTQAVKCIGALPPAGPRNYVAAFRHIHDLFAAAGATNVAFVWCLGSSGTDHDWVNYYPGSAYVDWIAVDGYERSLTTETGAFSQRFKNWYEDFSSFGKPMIITETGAFPSTGFSDPQPDYLHQIDTEISVQFPLLKGVAYFDSATAFHSYALDPAGLSAFSQLSANPFFQPPRQPTSVQANVSTAAPLAGQEVELSGSMSTTDAGGSLTFRLQSTGATIAGCDRVQVSLGTTCYTDALPQGNDNVVATYSGDAQFAPSTSGALPVSVQAQPATASGPQPPAIPGNGTAYLGAFENPQGRGVKSELGSLPGFNRQIARPLSIVHLFQQWSDPIPMGQVRQVRTDGAIPMIDWNCGDSDANIVAGADDALISSYARELASLRAPIFLRWYWEPNLPFSTRDAKCIGALGPAGYREAFQHIHDLFAQAGATNVAFVWSLATVGQLANVGSYYPGSAYVDWVAADGYNRSSSLGPRTFRNLFAHWYNAVSSFGKPLMISETASYSGAQAAFLGEVARDLPTVFPGVKALVYFDAPGTKKKPFALDSAGMGAFQALAADPYFQPARMATSMTVSVTPPASVEGQVVQLTANVPANDGGGFVSYYANNSPIPGCDLTPVDVTSSCSTLALPVGTTNVSATYSGDAYDNNAVAQPVPMSFGPMPGMAMPPFLGMPQLAALGAMSFFLTDRAVQPLDLSRDKQSYRKNFLNQFGSAGRLNLTSGLGALAIFTGLIILLVLALYITRSKWREKRMLQRLAGDGTESGGTP
jgi:endoglucanase